MAVFKRTEQIEQEIMQGGELKTVVEEVETTYVEGSFDGKPMAIAITDADIDSIYSMASLDYLENDLFEFVEEKTELQKDQIGNYFMENESILNLLIADIQREIDTKIDQLKPMIMEYCLARRMPVQYTKGGPHE